MNEEIDRLLGLQSGVISRRQLVAEEVGDPSIRRMLRRREWARVHDGVYVDHTGPLSWTQRAWAAVLFGWPAALCHDSALRAADGPGRRSRPDDAPIHIAVDRKRAVVAPSGVVPHQLADLDTKVRWNGSPPRVRIEEALVDVAAEAASEFTAIATLADAVQARSTTAARIRDALDGRSRVARRNFLHGVLTDIADGTCSVLEHGYLDRVERPHGLPRGRRQPPTWSGGRIYRDVEYGDFGLVVELNGRLFHDNARAHDRDLDRDLDAAIDGRLTSRVGWGQVFDRPCATARRVGLLLARRGWKGPLLPCPGCAAAGQPGFPATG